MEAITIVLPLPPRQLSPNGRFHWLTKAKAVSRYRGAAGLATRDAMNRAKLKTTPWDSATVRTVFYFPTNRRRDRDNAIASMKAYYDALADTGLVVNDSCLMHMPPEFRFDADSPRVELVIVGENLGLLPLPKRGKPRKSRQTHAAARAGKTVSEAIREANAEGRVVSAPNPRRSA